MMKFIILLLLIAAPFISSQGFPFRQQQPGGGGNNRRIVQGGNQDTRLGLLATDLGVAPVPGGHNFNNFGGSPNFAGGGGGFNNIGNEPQGCFCLPKNQVCNPSGAVPFGSTRISKLNTRIVNTNPQRPCPPDEIHCCFGGTGIPPIRLPPVGPSPQLRCGQRFRQFQGGSSSDARAEFAEYPWMAAVLNETHNFVAGGVILSSRTILTTAHSVQHPSIYRVRVGDYDLSLANEAPQFPHIEVPVSNIIFHSGFNSKTLANDVAIIQLAEHIPFNNHINTACLPETRQIFDGSRCYLSGWGKNAQGIQSGILREVDLPIINDFRCENLLQQTRLGSSFRLNRRSFICAGGEHGKDACTGDGGSPLVCQESSGAWTVAGLVAWGIGCGTHNIPGVYVNVASYSDFIKQYL